MSLINGKNCQISKMLVTILSIFELFNSSSVNKSELQNLLLPFSSFYENISNKLSTLSIINNDCLRIHLPEEKQL